MNENTTRVAAVATKAATGHYVALTYGGNDPAYQPSGAFHFRKLGSSKWVISHVDFTGEPDLVGQNPERTYHRTQPTLKEAQHVAERYVADLEANRARRRQAALNGARPVAPAPRSAPKATDVFYTLADGTKGSFQAPTADIERAIVLTKAQLIDDAIADGNIDAALDGELFTITKAQVLA